MDWFRTTDLTIKGNRQKEIWIRNENNSIEKFTMDLYLGKKTDLITLKKNIVNSIKKNVDYYKKTRTKLFEDKNMEIVKECPVCGASSENAEVKSNIYGAEYSQCTNCSHIFLIKRPNKKSINNFYLNDITYAATYTDKASAESRLNAIAVPWLKWTIEVYRNQYGKNPKRILDIGSGAGHFVEACRRSGIEANGIELSESSREFAKNVWNIELDGRDFIEVAKEYEGYDVVTFWGLLEHTPNPGLLVEAAHSIVSKSKNGGLVISKLPRWDSLSSAIQRLSTDTVIRHLDPMGHIMAFTDASAAEVYYRNGFKPVAAWYYGMDVYETLMQIGNKINSYEHLLKTGNLQMELQQFVDENKFSDGLTIVGVPK
jgi:2-polyprenyl-3-methyl-5-hydroxy-6-metoxy-1,4-benzoquinol methylase